MYGDEFAQIYRHVERKLSRKVSMTSLTQLQLKLHCMGFVPVRHFISIATHGFMTTWSRLSTFLQLNSCFFCAVKVVVAVGVVCYVLVDVRSYIALFIM